VRVIIVGASFTGTQLARHLVHEKYDVSIIESNEEKARHASNLKITGKEYELEEETATCRKFRQVQT